MDVELDALLGALSRAGGSDLHVKVNRPPLFRVKGELLPVDAPPLDTATVSRLIDAALSPTARERFAECGEVDAAYEVSGLARFRVNAFRQRGAPGAVMRLIPLHPPMLSDLGMPEAVGAFAAHENGLVLVTGPTGSGKTTTLAALIEEINQTRYVHVVTLEDPIEYVYTDRRATINQRELGLDTVSLSAALRSVLRQDPDIILMGEIRDAETLRFALMAAETGHLVFATLHTNDASQTMDRLMDLLPEDLRAVGRQQLSLLLRGVMCQRLLKRADGTGRVAALEIMVVSETVRQLIAENRHMGLGKAMEDGSYYGMCTFNQSLRGLVEGGVVLEGVALEASGNPEDLRLSMRGVRRGVVRPGG